MVSRVVVTRPREQAASLVAALERLSMEVMLFPTIEIEPVNFQVDRYIPYFKLIDAMLSLCCSMLVPWRLRYCFLEWLVDLHVSCAEFVENNIKSRHDCTHKADKKKKSALPLDKGFDFVIVTSANAVKYGKAILSRLSHASFIAIGQATADALKQAGCTRVKTPNTANSEGVLAVPELQSLKNKSVCLLTGKGGRGLLQRILSERGAIVNEIAVYQRRCPTKSADPIINFKPDYIICTSVESIKNLLSMVSQTKHGETLSQQLIVPSRRVADLAQSLGFKKLPIMSDGASDAAIIACLQ